MVIPYNTTVFPVIIVSLERKFPALTVLLYLDDTVQDRIIRNTFIDNDITDG